MPLILHCDYQKAFKQADIRGVYPTEIDEEATYFIARAFVSEYKLKEVVVGRDMRLSSPALHESFCRGVVDAGANVLDIGLVHTPLVYFVSGQKQLPGVMITASHSPKDHNGLKLVLPGAVPLTEETGLRQLRRRLARALFTEPEQRGRVKQFDFGQPYQRFVLKGFKPKRWEGFRVAVDCGNGMGGVMMGLLQPKLPVDFSILYPDPDGRMPNRGSDPTLSRNQQAIKKVIKTGEFDFGVAFDGDGDRIAFLDETGRYVNCAVIGALIAKHFLSKSAGERCVYTNLTGRIYEETIKQLKGKAVPARVGHAYVKAVMRKRAAVFGCEHSGHFFYRDFFYTDSIARTLLLMLDIYAEAKKSGLSFSELVAPYSQYQQTEDVIVPVPDRVKALESVYKFLLKKKPIRVRKFDGYNFDYGLVWGTVKISVTEPALKIMFEGLRRNEAQALQSEVVAYVRSL